MNRPPITVSAPPRPRFRLAACRRCGGDGFLDPTDGGEWRCLQCARPVGDPASIHHYPDTARAGQQARQIAA